MTEILTVISTNQSPVIFPLSKEKLQLKVKGFGNLIVL